MKTVAEVLQEFWDQRGERYAELLRVGTFAPSDQQGTVCVGCGLYGRMGLTRAENEEWLCMSSYLFALAHLMGQAELDKWIAPKVVETWRKKAGEYPSGELKETPVDLDRAPAGL